MTTVPIDAADPELDARGRVRRHRASIRRPRIAIAVTTAFFIVFYLPILIVVLFSFNSRKSLSSF